VAWIITYYWQGHLHPRRRLAPLMLRRWAKN